MKIFIIGTSNSIMGKKGYIEALELEHDVILHASGRNSIYYLLSIIIKKRTEIESCDLLIIDHYVNDVNFYYNEVGSDYLNVINHTYKYLSSLNTRIINLLFPLRDGIPTESLPCYKRTLENCLKYNISIIDLNSIDFKRQHFRDNVHLNHRTSFLVGLLLNNSLKKSLKIEKPINGNITKPDTYIINQNEIHNKNITECNIKSYKNNLLELSYVSIENHIRLEIPVNDRLIAIGYFNHKSNKYLSGIKINEEYKRALPSKGYFIEMLDETIKGTLTIKNITGNNKAKKLMRKSDVSGEFKSLNICELLIKNCEEELLFKPATRTTIPIDTGVLSKAINKEEPVNLNDIEKLNISNKTINHLRDFALSLEKRNILIANEIMELAQKARPNGTLINRKIRQYKNTLKL